MNEYLYNLAIEIIDEVSCLAHYSETECMESYEKIASLADAIKKLSSFAKAIDNCTNAHSGLAT